MKENNPVVNAENDKNQHFQEIQLSDCNVPIGCPWGADCPEDAFPDHW